IDMRPGMGNGLHFFNGPTEPVRIDQIFRLDLEELPHLLQALALMANVSDPCGQRFADGVVFKRHAKVDKPHIIEHELRPPRLRCIPAYGSCRAAWRFSDDWVVEPENSN